MRKRKNILLIISTLLLIVALSMSFVGCSFLRQGSITDFADTLFPQLFSSDALSANFFFENADKYLGITPTASLPSPSSKSDYESAYASYKSQAGLMAITYQYSKMSDDEKELFAFLQDFFINESEYQNYYYLQDNYIGGYNGMQASLPLYLTEYKFRDKQDIEDYISLCTQTITTFPEWVDYEVERIENGYGRPAFVLFYAIEQADSFTGAHIINTKQELLDNGLDEDEISISDYLDCDSPNPYSEEYVKAENFVLTNAKDKVSACAFLTEGEKTEYKNRITTAVNNYLIPAYIKLGNDIKSILLTPKYKTLFASNYGGLATLYGETGKSYYEVLFKDSTGTQDSIMTAYEKVLAAYKSLLVEINSIRTQLVNKGIAESDIDNKVVEFFNDDDWSQSALYDTIDTLKDTLNNNFPAFSSNAGEVTLKIVDESLKDNFAPAAFFVSALDNKSSDEVIVINNWDSTGYLSYDLLSHEGIPGHLYQYNYLKNSDVHDIVKVLCPTSYKEGWATYAEHYVAELYGTKDSVENLLMRYQVKKTLAKGYIRVISDILVNYEGYNATALVTYLENELKINDNAYLLNNMTEGSNGKMVKNTMTTSYYASNLIFNSIIDPCSAATYYYSYMNVVEIIDGLKAKGYSTLDAHKAYLDSPYTFTQIKDKFDL